nr:MAG TPA: hypothetical protein [Caudoviricetes sp.]
MQKIRKITRLKLDIVGYKTEMLYIRTYPKMTVKKSLFLLPQYARHNKNKGNHDGTKAKKKKDATL